MPPNRLCIEAALVKVLPRPLEERFLEQNIRQTLESSPLVMQNINYCLGNYSIHGVQRLIDSLESDLQCIMNREQKHVLMGPLTTYPDAVWSENLMILSADAETVYHVFNQLKSPNDPQATLQRIRSLRFKGDCTFLATNPVIDQTTNVSFASTKARQTGTEHNRIVAETVGSLAQFVAIYCLDATSSDRRRRIRQVPQDDPLKHMDELMIQGVSRGQDYATVKSKRLQVRIDSVKRNGNTIVQMLSMLHDNPGMTAQELYNNFAILGMNLSLDQVMEKKLEVAHTYHNMGSTGINSNNQFLSNNFDQRQSMICGNQWHLGCQCPIGSCTFMHCRFDDPSVFGAYLHSMLGQRLHRLGHLNEDELCRTVALEAIETCHRYYCQPPLSLLALSNPQLPANMESLPVDLVALIVEFAAPDQASEIILTRMVKRLIIRNVEPVVAVKPVVETTAVAAVHAAQVTAAASQMTSSLFQNAEHWSDSDSSDDENDENAMTPSVNKPSVKRVKFNEWTC